LSALPKYDADISSFLNKEPSALLYHQSFPWYEDEMENRISKLSVKHLVSNQQ